MLHGYGTTGDVEEAYLHLTGASDAHGFLYAYATGTTDASGSTFWNATDGCCNFYGSTVDDVTYIDAIFDDVASKYNVDKSRVFIFGHSNGGFMAHRYACDRAPRVAAIVALAGDNWNDPSKCNPTAHVAALQIHGDMDPTILYGGGMSTADGGTGGIYPSAHDSVATWAQKDACTGMLTATGMTLDLVANIAGNETKVETYGGCPTGIDVALWTMQGAGHIPAITRPGFVEAVWGFFSSHPKP
jgi:polyhydroxybutyrate depolymerase